VKVTLITVCKNEEVLMPFFLRHYADIVDKIYLFDNCSTDNSMKIAAKCPKVEIRSFDTGGLLRDEVHVKIKNQFYTSMKLDGWIIAIDFDEFLYHKDLRGLLQSYDARGINFPLVRGFNMIGTEVPKDDGVTPIIELLNMEVQSEIGSSPGGDYNKRAVFNSCSMSLVYGLGCHTCWASGNVVPSENADIFLLHYKWLSREYGLGVFKSWTNSPQNIKNGCGIVDLAKKAAYYDDSLPKRIAIPGLELETLGAMRPPNNPLRTGLVEFVNSLPDNLVMAEVGCFRGESASYFAKKASKVYCIDPWLNYTEKLEGGHGVNLTVMSEAEAAFDRVAAKFPNVIVKTKGTSVEMAKTFADEFFDMVYIDANHEYSFVVADIAAWLPKVKKKGGIIAGHDYEYTDANGKRDGVALAVKNICGVPDMVFPDSTWMKHLPYFLL
jgi:hypothetical protein